jgi:hypothetical protein
MKAKLDTGILSVLSGAALALLFALAVTAPAQMPAQGSHIAAAADAATTSPSPAASPADITWGS